MTIRLLLGRALSNGADSSQGIRPLLDGGDEAGRAGVTIFPSLLQGRWLAVAARQQAKSHELRTTMSLGRIGVRRGQTAKASAALSNIDNWFTEGFGTPDLIEVKQLLQEWGLP